MPRGPTRGKLRRIQWGKLLPADRGGQLEHCCRIYVPDPEELVKCISSATAMEVLARQDEPTGNYVCINVEQDSRVQGYPVYINVPAHLLPGQMAHMAAKGVQDWFGSPGGRWDPAGQVPQLHHRTPPGEPAQPSLKPNSCLHTVRFTATQRMPVILDGRSLGAHMDSTHRRVGTTLTRRMDAAVPVCRRIGQLPVGLDIAIRLISGKAVPGATFGSECTSVNTTSARKLRTEITMALVGKNYSNSSPEVALHASTNVILDPELKILDLRLTALRRVRL